MGPNLINFLNSHAQLVEDSATWGNGTLPLRITAYLSCEQPPLAYVTSVRAVVLQGNSVLVVRDAANSFHVTPGGRREKDESVEATLRREVLEETGWTLADASPLGYMHFHHLAPRLVDYIYPHPDFVQLVYAAHAGEFLPEAQQLGEYELETGFRSVAEAQGLNLTVSQRLFLDAALRASG
jgi:8-oxo-dGTP pyrophosphatase MutT (NUDIX family)